MVKRLVPCTVTGYRSEMQQDMAVNPNKPRISEQIDENLKLVYDKLLKEQVPDRFKELLAKLKETESGK